MSEVEPERLFGLVAEEVGRALDAFARQGVRSLPEASASGQEYPKESSPGGRTLPVSVEPRPPCRAEDNWGSRNQGLKSLATIVRRSGENRRSGGTIIAIDSTTIGLRYA